MLHEEYPVVLRSISCCHGNGFCLITLPYPRDQWFRWSWEELNGKTKWDMSAQKRCTYIHCDTCLEKLQCLIAASRLQRKHLVMQWFSGTSAAEVTPCRSSHPPAVVSHPHHQWPIVSCLHLPKPTHISLLPPASIFPLLLVFRHWRLR